MSKFQRTGNVVSAFNLFGSADFKNLIGGQICHTYLKYISINFMTLLVFNCFVIIYCIKVKSGPNPKHLLVKRKTK